MSVLPENCGGVGGGGTAAPLPPPLEWVLGFVIDYAWTSRILRDAVFTWRPSWLKSDLFRDLFGEFGNLNSSCIRKSSTVLFLSSWKDKFIHLDGHQHGVSIQSYVNLGNTLLRIAREWKLAERGFSAKLFILQLSIISLILELSHWMITTFSFDHMTDENREF